MLHAFSPKKTRNTVKNITWLELNHPSLSKRSTGCTRQDLGRKHSILMSVTHMLCVSQVCHGVSHCADGESCSWSKSQWDILLSQQMLDTIKHITGGNFFSFRKTAHRCIVCV